MTTRQQTPPAPVDGWNTTPSPSVAAGPPPGGPPPPAVPPPPPPPPPQPANTGGGAGGSGADWVGEAHDNFREGGVFWKPAQWENMPHLFLGITDLGEVETQWDEKVLTVNVDYLVAFRSMTEWCLYTNAPVRQKALYWRLRDNMPRTFGWVRRGERGNSPQAPWVLVKADEGLRQFIGEWARENTEHDPLTGQVKVVGRPTLAPPLADTADGGEPF